MKTKTTLLLMLITGTLFFSSCKKDDNTSPSSSNNPTLSTLITSGSWRVSYFLESSDDHTSNFTGYVFQFNSNGTMTADVSGSTTNGTWSMDDSNNEFHIDLGNIAPLKDLSHGWTVISKTSTEIVLRDNNATHNEEVHFTKN